LTEDTSGIRRGSDISGAPDASLQLRRRGGAELICRAEGLPAEFGEPVVVDAEVMGDLVHDRSEDLVSSAAGALMSGAAGGA
jgi:hypothetical protein